MRYWPFNELATFDRKEEHLSYMVLGLKACAKWGPKNKQANKPDQAKTTTKQNTPPPHTTSLLQKYPFNAWILISHH